MAQMSRDGDSSPGGWAAVCAADSGFTKCSGAGFRNCRIGAHVDRENGAADADGGDRKSLPQQTGAEFDTPHLLEPITPYRRDLTVYSGLDHGVKGGHFAVHSFLSGVRQVDAKGMPDGNISLDQRVAETVGGETRFPSLTFGSEEGFHGGCMMCWMRSGTRVNPIQGPRELFPNLIRGGE